jgi:hypothetical protein
MTQKKTFAEKLRHPKWQRKSLEEMERDGFRCMACGDEGSSVGRRTRGWS